MEAEPKREETSILTIPSIPDELITEILLRLPVKFLLRFRCVSKSWLSLISSPRFVKIHLLLSVNNKDYTRYRVMFSVYNPERDIKDCALSSLLCDNSVTGAFDLDYPGRVPGEFPRIVGSTCGLICLAIWVGGFYDLFLWNPSVREYTKLPKFRPSGSKLYPFNFIYRNYFSFGFAYDELKDDYKVVGVFDINGLRSEVEIYSVKSNSWRRIKDLQGGVMRCVSGKLVDGKLLADGKLYWLDHGRNILSIDLADEKWTVVGIPLDLRLSDLLALGAFGGDICLFSGEIGNGGVDHVDVWVTKEYGVEEFWTNIFTINSFDQSIAINPPIIMSNEGEILLRRASRFAKYNIKDDSIKYLDVTNYAQYHHAEIYVESLLCPF